MTVMWSEVGLFEASCSCAEEAVAMQTTDQAASWRQKFVCAERQHMLL